LVANRFVTAILVSDGHVLNMRCCRKSTNNNSSNSSTTMLSRFFQQTSVLALPWWQRVLLVAPVCLILWLGVVWALGGE